MRGLLVSMAIFYAIMIAIWTLAWAASPSTQGDREALFEHTRSY